MAANENTKASAGPEAVPADGPAAQSAPQATPAQGASGAASPAASSAPVSAPETATPAVAAAQDSHATSSAQESKAKKLLGGLKNAEVWTHAKGITRDLVSEDQPTRKMARYFFLALAGIVIVLTLAVTYIREIRIQARESENGKSFGEFLAKQAQEAKLKFSSQSLGTFTIELKKVEASDSARIEHNVMNLAEIEVIVSCDEKETCDYLEDNLPQARNQLTDVFVAMDRDELLSKEGKRRLKVKAMQKLNNWLPNGKVENLFFDKLVVN